MAGSDQSGFEWSCVKVDLSWVNREFWYLYISVATILVGTGP